MPVVPGVEMMAGEPAISDAGGHIAAMQRIVRNDVPTPNADKPYPQNIVDLKGLKIGISGRGASTDTATRFMLKQAGLDPDKDVTIMPVGDPGTMLASLKNKVIDAVMAVEPAQTAAVQSLKIAKTMVDLEGGGGPDVFHPYAYNGVFVRSAFLKDHPDTARAIVAAMKTTGVRRIVAVSAAPVSTVPSRRRPSPPKHDPGDGFFMRHLFTHVASAMFGKVYADLAQMEDILADSGLDWTIVRPPQLTDKPLTGSYRTAYGQNIRGGWSVPRADVAHLMLHALGQSDMVHQAIGIAS